MKSFRVVRQLLFTLSVVAITATGWGSTAALAAHAIPAPPTYYVLDEPKVLSPQALQSLQALLVEHDHLTSEQILVAVFNSLEGEDPVDFTNRVFSQWRIGQRGKDNGVLIALYWKEHKARIEVGYGLEPILTDARSKTILNDFLIPELKQGNADRALTLTVFQILSTLESPLIKSGQAEQILRSGGFRGSWHAPRSSQPMTYGWVVWLVLGLIIASIVFNQLTAREAHFTREGWYSPRPWRRRSWVRGGWPFGGGWGGGGWGSRGGDGGFGGWGGGSGGGGGFLGGGGSSGGGGASGDW